MELIKQISDLYMLQLGSISNIVFCEISHFTDFPNILALSSCEKTGQL